MLLLWNPRSQYQYENPVNEELLSCLQPQCGYCQWQNHFDHMCSKDKAKRNKNRKPAETSASIEESNTIFNQFCAIKTDSNSETSAILHHCHDRLADTGRSNLHFHSHPYQYPFKSPTRIIFSLDSSSFGSTIPSPWKPWQTLVAKSATSVFDTSNIWDWTRKIWCLPPWS